MGDLKHTIRVKPGKVVKASDLNHNAGNTPTLVTGGGRNKVRKFGDRIVISEEADTRRLKPTNVRRFVVDTVETDFLYCYTWDGTTQGTELIAVALPYLLRRTPFDGLTRSTYTYAYTNNIERVSTADDDTEETQQITPAYIAGDEILAVRYIKGNTVAYDDYDALISWEDMNTDGRQWAKVTT
jgi:hypothetical protein